MLSGVSVWFGSLAGRPEAQRGPPALRGPSDHPPITKPADGEGPRADWHKVLSEMLTKNNSHISENMVTQWSNNE